MPASTPSPSPLPETKAALVAQLVDGLSAPSLQWLSGYMAGAASLLHGAAAAHAPEAEPTASERLSIVYGSQTGNSRRVAEQLARRAEAGGLAVRLLRADAYPMRELKQERLLYVVISTHSNEDDVEPPDDARGFVEFLGSRRAPQLPQLKYAVLGLGDSSYPDFCGIGRRLDERLAELGATRLHPRGDADVDVDTVAAPWLDAALARAGEQLGRSDARVPLATVTPLRPRPPAWTRDKPFAAEVLLNQPIVADDGARDIRHVELSLADSGLHYEPGDALGVWPTQAPELVEAVLGALKLDGDTVVEHDGEALPLARWLGERRELTRLTRPFLAAHATRGDHATLQALLAPDARESLAQLFDTQQLVDLLQRHPAEWDASSLVAALRPLAPRMYSIASSRKLVDDEVHLTVANLHYRHEGQERWGTASRYLAARAEGDRVPVFVEANERFRLPADTDRDIIMVGPGTGVAPFRAFVQERQATGAGGRNWLLFGNRHRRTDFLYQLEWQAALKNGALHRLDVAFSRDQADKLYVQHRLREHGREVHAWLAGGAHLYVCGDAARMAGDVHAALVEIAMVHGGKSRDDADAWLNTLLAEGRYARDG